MSRLVLWLWIAPLVAGGCSGDDAAGDGGPADGAVDGGVDGPVRAAPPAIEPCPEGWRVVPGEPTTCDPWAEDGPERCGDGQAHFPGQAGCVPAGDGCPEGEWPGGLPTDATVLRVRAGATSGGDGSADTPFGTVAEALSAAEPGDVVALGAGTFDETVYLPEGVTLWGRCAADTRVAPAAPPLTATAIVDVTGPDAAIRNVTVDGDLVGVRVRDGASVDLGGVVVDGARIAGVMVMSGGAATADALVVRDTQQRTEGVFGMGVLVEEEASLELARGWLEGNHSGGLVTLGGDVAVTDTAILDTLPQDYDGGLGSSVGVLGGAEVTVERSVLDGSHDVGAAVDEASHLVLRRSVLRNVESRARDLRFGLGVYAQRGSRATLERTVVRAARGAGILVEDPESSVRLLDSVIAGTRAQEADGEWGNGLLVQGDARAELERVVLAENRGASSIVFSGAAELTDVTIRDTLSLESDGRQGVGLHAQGGASVTGRRVTLLRNRHAGMEAIEAGTSIVLEDVIVEDTLERACATDDCPGLGFGDGVMTAVDARISLTRFRVGRSARVGVHVGGGVIDLSQGLVADNPIGANVQVPEYDLARINDRVVYRDNDRNLDTGSLPLTEPSSSF